jgi:type II secretory pathway pseudopilin PulG
MIRALHRMRVLGTSTHADEAGFTMVELVVGIFIFALVIGGVVAGMSSSLNLTRQNRNRSIAANLASQEMDTMRSTDFVDLPLGMVITTQTVDGVPYVVTRQSEWVTPNATSGACQAPSGSTLAYLSITVSVTWDNMAGVPAPVSHTVVTPPVGTYDTSRGHIAVMVRDAAGVPQEGVPVALSGPSVTDTQTTSIDGCAFFAYEPSGAYTVTLSKTGYVNDQGVVSPVQSATVVAGSTVSLQYQYDNAATLSLTLQGNTGSSAPSTVPVTLGNTHILPAGKQTFTGSGSPRTISGRFPYSDGYEAWTGSCLDADPEGVNGSGVAFYPNASRATPIAVSAGATSVATVLMPEVLVHAQTSLGIPRSVSVTVSHAADTGCPSGVSYTLGTTDAAGNLTAALPYGVWTVTAGSTNGGTVTLSPLDPPTPVTKNVIVP